MLYIFHGQNSWAMAEALRHLEAQVGPPEVRDSNYHRLPASQTSLAEVQGYCWAVPFLAERRLVVLEGLLEMAESRTARGSEAGKGHSALEAWEGLAEVVKGMPPTNILALVDGRVSPQNPLLRRLRSLAEVRAFPNLAGEELNRWVKERATTRGGSISPGAIKVLVQLVGNNLHALDNEMEKLCLYASGRAIEERDVRLLVPQEREASIFAAVDALLEHRLPAAVQLTRRLRASGAPMPYILAMLARQLRLVVLAKELVEGGASEQEVGQRLSISADFALRRTLEQARRHPWPSLKALYRGLLEADLAVKTGRLDQDIALELLVSQLAAPGPSRRP